MAGISFKIEGLDKVLSAIDTYKDKTVDGIDDVLTGFAFDTVALAKELAPTDDSNLKQNIGFEDKRLSKELYSHANYSAYLEFGTGAKVDVPAMEGIDLPAYALTFFVNGKGHINPHPFFFPAIQANVKKLVEDIKKVLQTTKG